MSRPVRAGEDLDAETLRRLVEPVLRTLETLSAEGGEDADRAARARDHRPRPGPSARRRDAAVLGAPGGPAGRCAMRRATRRAARGAAMAACAAVAVAAFAAAATVPPGSAGSGASPVPTPSRLSVSIAHRGGDGPAGQAAGMLSLRDPGEPRWRARLSTAGFWAPRVDAARLLHAARCGTADRCVLLELEGASRPSRPGGYCGAGMERAWLWARLDHDGRATARTVHPVASCLYSIEEESESPGPDAPGRLPASGVLSRTLWETVPRHPDLPTREETRALEYDTRRPHEPPRERVLRSAPLAKPAAPR